MLPSTAKPRQLLCQANQKLQQPLFWRIIDYAIRNRARLLEQSYLQATSRYVPSLSGIALIAATMFSAVNSPTPRVLFGMVASGAAGFVSFVLAGAFRASLLSCGALWALGVPNWSATYSRRLLGLVCRPLRAAKRAAQLSRPSGVVFALPFVSGSIVGPALLPRGSRGCRFRWTLPPLQSAVSVFVCFNVGCHADGAAQRVGYVPVLTALVVDGPS